MGKVLALAPFVLLLIAVACGGATSQTTEVTPGAPQAQEAAPVAGAFNADIKDFAHQDITVPVGTTVAWTNRDSAPHTTTEDSEFNIWDSFALQPGQSFSFTFTDVGTFNYFCAIHPTMMATITVTGPQGAQPVSTATVTPPEPEPQPSPTAAAGDALAALTANADMQNFKHQDLTLQASTTVVWTNRDRVQHTVTSGSPSDPDAGSLFDSGSNRADWVAQGETYSFKFNQAGVFSYYCRLHGAAMSGTITVTTAQPGAHAPTTAPASTPEPAAASRALTANADIQDFAHQDLSVNVGTIWWSGPTGATLPILPPLKTGRLLRFPAKRAHYLTLV